MGYEEGMSRRFTEDEVRELIAEAVAPLLGRIAELEAEVERHRQAAAAEAVEEETRQAAARRAAGTRQT